MFNWIKKLFKKKHKHEMVWTSRKFIENTSADFTTHGIIDIEPAKTYLYQGYCITCGQKGFISKLTIASIFDKEQPYDI